MSKPTPKRVIHLPNETPQAGPAGDLPFQIFVKTGGSGSTTSFMVTGKMTAKELVDLMQEREKLLGFIGLLTYGSLLFKATDTLESKGITSCSTLSYR